MRVWFDALTSKQALIAVHLKLHFEAHNHEFLVTCRDYDYIVSLFRKKGIEPVICGTYGETLEEKVIAGLKRELFFVKLWSHEGKPSIHISLTSPEASRIAFRLKIPIILLTDSPHSIYVNKLTIPLADALITPICIPKSSFNYLIEPSKIIQFNGLFEVMWVKRYLHGKPKSPPLGLRPSSYIVVRPEEKKASYYESKSPEPTVAAKIISHILKETDLTVIFFPRYKDQEHYIRKMFGKKVIIPVNALDSLPLLQNALTVVTGGLTMATEASLLGTPAITFFPRELPVMRYVMDKGLPLFHLRDLDQVTSLILKIYDAPRKYRMESAHVLNLMEDPSSLIVSKAEELCGK